MSIKRRIWSLPLIATVIFGVGLAVSVSYSTKAISSIKTTEDVDYPLLDNSKRLSGEVNVVVDALKDAVTEGDKKRLDQAEEDAKAVRARLQAIGKLADQSKLAEHLSQEFESYYKDAFSVAKIMLNIDQGDPSEAVARMQNSLNALQGDLTKAQDTAQHQFTVGIQHSGDSVRSVLYTSILVSLFVIAALVAVSYFVVRAIWKQLGGEPEYACEIAVAVASGDLSMHIDAESDSGSLLFALREMQHRLESMVVDVKTSAETIKVASAEISSGNSDLSSRTEAQASSLEETASSMEQMTDTVKQNAENARQANQLVGSATDVALKGGEVVARVVTTMSEINDSSKKIVDIITVIDGIAFQTNILALNAAVEAARAGEQGRGFAVVAAEVRNLAQRSAAAAKEIKALINDSVERVDNGTALVDQAGKTMEDIVASVRRVSDIMTEISGASQEQSAGIQEIGLAIGQMDEMTQQNSALVEQAAAAAESLLEQAEGLNVSLNAFKLSASAVATRVPLRAQPPARVAQLTTRSSPSLPYENFEQ